MIDELLNLTDRDTKRRLYAAIAPLQGLHEVTIKPRRMTRSTRANAYHWSCIVDPFRKFLESQGQHYTSLECHEFLKVKCLPKNIVDPRSGEVVGIVGDSSHNKNTAEFAEFVNRCKEYLGDTFGIECPDPQLFMDDALAPASKGAA